MLIRALTVTAACQAALKLEKDMPNEGNREVARSEAIEIRLRRGRSWLHKARRAGVAGDLDSQFVFLWIAFNALYGQPRYREGVVSDEIADFKALLEAVEQASRNQVATTLRRPELEAHVEKILRSPFLNIECWRHWDKLGIRDRSKRIATACNTYHKEHGLNRLFLRLYTLRNQVLHGAATDGGQRNRESLRHAIAVLDPSVDALIELVKRHHVKIPGLESLPFPPSVGEGGVFNPPWVGTARP